MPHHHCIADLPDHPAQWLWPGRIPRGAVTLIIGDSGRGKSLLTLDIAARVSAGAPWPDGAPASTPGHVLLLSAEDSLLRTVRTRLSALDANLNRVHYINSGQWNAPTETPSDTYFRIGRSTAFGSVPSFRHDAASRDAEHLKDAAESIDDCRLIVVDPISAYLRESVDGDLDATRISLAALASIADATGAAIVAVAHRDQLLEGHDKRRTSPIRALAAMARAIHLVDRFPADSSRNILITAKCNLAAPAPPLTYRVTSDALGGPSIEWSFAPTDFEFEGLQPPRAALASRAQRLTETDRAVAWLHGALAAGPVASLELTQRAKAAGISARTFTRARTRLGVQASKPNQVGATWQCALPDKNAQESRVGHFEDLADLALLADSVITEHSQSKLPDDATTTAA